MKPLSLTLKGFRGIRDGLGRDELTLDFERLAGAAQLIAIAGPNGRGKTTLMDNMHPYLTMPSRAAIGGPGGFSYYDHVYLPENEKDLIWVHGDRCYQSQTVFRLNGKRKTEAFLFVHDTTGWEPVRLEDGTVSDGKVETYERCVEAILGNAETFFTSVFSAQGKRQLTAYKNAEIKTLLADLLGLDEIRILGQKAAETAKLLKAGLTAMRHEQAGFDDESHRIAAVETALGGWTLFAKCLSNDGVIALAIDDAGPVLSGLANDLLLACYGARFTVSIKTLVKTGKGEQREGFDIVVHDAESTERKSVSLMSGGERVWINECLVRAVALYLAQNTGRRYATLFSDEADGPLDPERKRMFMEMKREVLRLGGYDQEFFVSQTPELTAVADAVIDLDAIAMRESLDV